jgi:hypothetical protein
LRFKVSWGQLAQLVRKVFRVQLELLELQAQKVLEVRLDKMALRVRQVRKVFRV